MWDSSGSPGEGTRGDGTGASVGPKDGPDDVTVGGVGRVGKEEECLRSRY